MVADSALQEMVSRAVRGMMALVEQISHSDLLIATIIAFVVGGIGSMMVRRDVAMGGLVRMTSTLALCAILVTVFLQIARFDPRVRLAVPELGLPEQTVEGGETRIPLAADGHYWLNATLNGHPTRFMVDTGATLTAISENTAIASGVAPRRGGIPVQLNTANGTISAQLGSIEDLHFGNVAARGLDTVIAPNLGETNVIGMNLLSRLKGWRVEEGTMILQPHHPQPVVEFATPDR